MKKNLIRYLEKEFFILLFIFFISLLLAVSIAFGLYLWKIIYDQLFRKPDTSLFILIAVLSIAAVFITNLLTVVRDRTMSLLNRNLVSNIRKDFLTEVMHYKYSFFLERNSSEFVKRAMEDCRIIADGLSGRIMEVVNFVQIGFWLVFFLYFAPLISEMYLIFIIAFTGWVFIWRKKYETTSFEIGKEYDVLWKNLLDIFSGIKTIKLDLLKSKVIQNMDENLTKMSYIKKINSLYSNMLWNIIYIMVWSPVLFILIFMIPEVVRGNVTIGTLVFCLLFNERFITPLNELAGIFISQRGLKSAKKRLYDYLSDDIEKGGDLEFHGIRQKIEFKNVSFSYQKSHFALKNVSLEIPYGKNVAIYGKSGSGKSTIAALLVRLFDPASGSIFIDGVPHSSFDLESFRKGIVMISQDIPIYSGTLRENIDLKKRLKDDEILDLMKKVRLFDFLARLPAGINTTIAEGLVDISGGERQRLGIARALAFHSSIYIFDEITASLDRETEKEITDLLYTRQKGITSLTITHNADILKMMDIIYDLADGCLKRRS